MRARIGIVGDIAGHIGFVLQEQEGCAFADVFSPSVRMLCHAHDELWGNLEGPCTSAVDLLDCHRQQEASAAGAPHLFVSRRQVRVLRELGPHPDSSEPIRLLEGRYGPYVTDGTTNASLPKDLSADAVTLDAAVGLLRARQDAGPRRGARRSATRRATSGRRGSKRTATGDRGD